MWAESCLNSAEREQAQGRTPLMWQSGKVAKWRDLWTKTKSATSCGRLRTRRDWQVTVQNAIGPWPIHEVVPMAVRNAVSAATKTFTASSMMRCFFIITSFLFLSHRFHRFHRFSFLSRIWELENFSAMIRIFASQWIWELFPAEEFFVTQIPQISQIFFLSRIREFLSLSHSSLATTTIL